MPRAVVGGVFAMPRPARPRREELAVKDAASMIGRGSVQAKSQEIARRVVADALVYLDMDLDDPMIAALADAQTALTPISTLARCPAIDTAGEITDCRVERYRTRSGRQLTDEGRARETAEIAMVLQRRLAARYAKHLRK